LAQDNKLISSLIESSRNGNNNAFEQLFRIHVGYIYAISFRLLGNFEDANENTTQIFTEAWKTISMVRRDSPFILWLKAIAIYSSLQRIREKDKHKKNRGEQLPNPKGLSFIDQELMSLADSERIVFVLNDIEHYKKEEISDLLSITKDEVENLLNNAREIIINKLVIKTNEALERALKQIPESIEPAENLFEGISADMLKNIPNKKETPELVKDMDDESNDRILEPEKKIFSFKDLFKKKKK
jgi:RNA polymerase sigma-70 factor, ECF subfamily